MIVIVFATNDAITGVIVIIITTTITGVIVIIRNALEAMNLRFTKGGKSQPSWQCSV